MSDSDRRTVTEKFGIVPLKSTNSPIALEDRQLQEMFDGLHAAAGRDERFLRALIDALRHVLEGRFGATFVVAPDHRTRVVAASPAPPDGHLTVEPDRMQLLRDCVARCVRKGDQMCCPIQEREQYWDAVCTPLLRQGVVEGVCVVLTEAQDAGRLRTRMGQARWLCQLYPGHVAKRMLGRHIRQAAHMRGALDILNSARHATRFEASCMNVCNRLRTQMRAQRVSLSWAFGNSVRLQAMSDTENLDRRQEPNRCLEAAMEECFDQCQPIVAQTKPLRPGDPSSAEPVCRCHSELVDLDGSGAACSVPLRDGEQVVGVLTLELPARRSFTTRSIANIEAVADLVGPTLAHRYRHERPVLVKTCDWMRRAAGVVVGPQHVGAKLSVLAVGAVLVYVCLATWEYRIGAEFSFDASGRRIYSAYFDSTIEYVGAHKGDAVEAGQVLARMDASEIRMDLKKIDAQLAEEKTIHRLAIGDGQTAEARRAEARVRRHEAERERLKFLSTRAAVTASEAGVVLRGDWPQRIGERIQRGQVLFEVAPIEHLRAVIYVDETQIDRVGITSRGELAARAEPDKVIGFTVERIVPVGEPLRGRNVFEVHAQLDRTDDWMKPGMWGTAKIDCGSEPVVWITTHRLIDFLRLKLWM